MAVCLALPLACIPPVTLRCMLEAFGGVPTVGKAEKIGGAGGPRRRSGSLDQGSRRTGGDAHEYRRQPDAVRRLTP